MLRLAALDGRMLLFIAGGFAVLAAAAGQGLPATAGCLAAGAGAMELHGAQLLRHGDERGMSWLIRSQLTLLAIILGYVGIRLAGFDPEPLMAQLDSERLDALRAAGMADEEILPALKMAYMILYGTVGVVSILYQGGMALYYHRKRGPVEQALASLG